MRISINEILVIIAAALVVMIVLNQDGGPLRRMQQKLAFEAGERRKAARAREKAQEERRRRETRCRFRDGFHASQFEWMVQRAGRYLPWITHLQTEGPVVHGIVETGDGEPAGDFTLDFNDYGHITGRYWVTSSVQSDLPARLAAYINRELDDWKSGVSRPAYRRSQRSRRLSGLRRHGMVVVITCLLVTLLIGIILRCL